MRRGTPHVKPVPAQADFPTIDFVVHALLGLLLGHQEQS